MSQTSSRFGFEFNRGCTKRAATSIVVNLKRFLLLLPDQFFSVG